MSHNRKRWKKAVLHTLTGIFLAVLAAYISYGREAGKTIWPQGQLVDQAESGQAKSISISTHRLEGVTSAPDGQPLSVSLRSNGERTTELEQKVVTVSVQSQRQEDSSYLLEIAIVLLTLTIALGSFVFWLWMLIDCATKEPNEGSNKLVWVLIILFVNFLGALAYFFIRRPQRIRELGQ
ncbi:MAG TPA: PLD nuclease N-terminal domain-containing protein [Trichocoleus sp.]